MATKYFQDIVVTKEQAAAALVADIIRKKCSLCGRMRLSRESWNLCIPCYEITVGPYKRADRDIFIKDAIKKR